MTITDPRIAWREGFDTIDADTLMNKPMHKNKYLVEGLLPHGVTILGGSSKVGKSWFVLDLALKLATGEPIWEKETTKCGVLYLCLEDTLQRIQNRLMMLTDEAPPNLRFATTASTITNGLEKDINTYLYSYPDTKLIIIDTLQKVRAEKEKYTGGVYANDYADMTILKNITAERDISILLVHHLRKQPDSDAVNMLSGSTGIGGAVDTLLILQRPMRIRQEGKLFATGRDIEDQEYILAFDNLRWRLLERKDSEALRKERIPPFVFKIVDLVAERKEWTGNATELLETLGEKDVSPPSAVKAIVQNYYEVLYPAEITFEQKRTNKSRLLIFTKRNANNVGDGQTVYTDKSVTAVTTVTEKEKYIRGISIASTG